MALEWLDGIERRAKEATESVPEEKLDDSGYWQHRIGVAEDVLRFDVPRLCRAVRQQNAALRSLVDAVRALWRTEEMDDMGAPDDELSLLGQASDRLVEAVQEAERTLQRWEHGEA